MRSGDQKGRAWESCEGNPEPAVQASQEPSGGELGRGKKVRMQDRLTLEKEALGTASPAFPIRKEKKGQTKSEGVEESDQKQD